MSDLKVDPRRFRPELEGIRAVAALLVAVYHIWFGRVSGGVDVFFVVSGYLITTSLLSRILRDDKIIFSDYYLGLGRRLFPLAYTVIAVTTIVSVIKLPISFWTETIPQAIASIFYYENWQLAWNTVDYLGQNNEASPFQHFWALSLQGQFYVTWPILITIVYFVARRLLKTPVRKTLLAVLVVLFISSLTYSIYLTNVDQPYAYFNTFARVWEFSLGGILALLLPYLNPTKAVSFILGWLGLSIIVFTGMVFQVSTLFPGYIALLPVSGALLVIIAAENSHIYGADRLLSTKPFQYFGGISYGFYLWHWPLLIYYYLLFETDTVPFLHGLLLLVISFILSVVSIRLLEEPVRSLSVKKDRTKVKKYVAFFAVIAIVPTFSWAGYVEYAKASKGLIVVEDYPGARAISSQIEPKKRVEAYPDLLTIKEELPHFYDDLQCYSTMQEGSEVKECSFGELENPELTIALVGGSHSGHWFPALEPIAEKHKLKIRVFNKDACRFTNDDFEEHLTEACMEWSDNVTELLKKDPVDLIFTTANVAFYDHIPEGYVTKWKEFEGISEIFAIRDNPRMPEDTPNCLAKNPKRPKVCGISKEEALSENLPWDKLDEQPKNVTFADLSDYFCIGGYCPPIIGNVIVYRDQHHLSTYYAETLSEALEIEMLPLIERLKEQK